MSKRSTSKVTPAEIVDYWSNNISEWELSVDFADALERCWRCGYKSKLEKCHIIPHSLNGLDESSNYVLLCGLCHSEGPNVNDRDFFLDWLKAHKATFYDSYWTTRGIKEYEFIYKKSLASELDELGISKERISNLMMEEGKKCSWHFGQPRWNPATIAGLFRIVTTRIRKEEASNDL